MVNFIRSNLLSSLILLVSCNYFKDSSEIKPDKDTYFEGEIKIAETQGLWGELYKMNTTYLISENSLKREQVLGGINRLFNVYAGITIDLIKDTILLYYSDKLSNTKIKHSSTIKEYKTYLQTESISGALPSPLDNTYTILQNPTLVTQVKDSLKMKGFSTDYTLYKDSSGFLKLEIFDTRKIKIKRELLELTFINLPKAINFPLKSEITTSTSEVEMDSLKEDSAINKQMDISKLSKNKWIRKSFKILKKGVDLAIHITTQISEITKRKIIPTEYSLPEGSFTEIKDFDEFMHFISSTNSEEFDD